MPATKLYRDGTDTIEVSGESPAGFQGVLFLATRNGKEFLITPQQIAQLEPETIPETVVQHEPQTQPRRPRKRRVPAKPRPVAKLEPVVTPKEPSTWATDLQILSVVFVIFGLLLAGVLNP